MQRRDFLASAGVAVGALSIPLQRTWATTSAQAEFSLWSSASGAVGARFLPHALAPCADCSAETLQVHIDGLHNADTGAVLKSLDVHALFDLPGGGSAPFHAWHYAAEPMDSRSGPVQFIAGRASMRQLVIDYRLHADPQPQRQSCALTRLDLPLISPGHYLLLSPRQGGASLAGLRLEHSGNPLAPLSGLADRDFDYFAFRIQTAV